ncbi:MAG: hypothetical protein FJX72_22210 [Armatimonadetes bacterium]|nr:hypothetical protein [Armatimonadota bacterium]
MGLGWATPAVREAWRVHARRMETLYRGEEIGAPFFINGLMAGRSHGLWGTNDPDMLNEPDAWLDDVFADMAARASEASDPRTFRPFVIEIDPFGTHFIDALFDAPVRYHEGQAWSEELACDLADLLTPDIEGNPVFRASLDLARMAVERSGGAVWIANPVLSCPINIGINLFGGRLLEAMMERPAEAHRVLGLITDVIAFCMRAFASVIPPEVRQNSVGAWRWAPPGRGFIDGCATHLVSARHYREFLAPLDAALLAGPRPALRPSGGGEGGGGMIHLCGAHTQHIPAWRNMPELASVQLNDRAADDFEAYRTGLRPDQIIYVTPTADMTVERILAITSGERVVLQCPAPETQRCE